MNQAVLTHQRRAEAASNAVSILAAPTRYQVLSVLLTLNSDPCVRTFDHTGLPADTVSHVLANLDGKGIGATYQRGRTVCYHVRESRLTRHLRSVINEFSQYA